MEHSIVQIDNVRLCEVLRPPKDEDDEQQKGQNRGFVDCSSLYSGMYKNHSTSKRNKLDDQYPFLPTCKMIRNSENFVYIENQYFMGSAYTWHFDNETNCHHTIPAELVQKIVSKIASNQRFTAYVVIPMFPEGDPAHQAMQEILYWQTRTIEMMYGKIGEALRRSPTLSSSHPTDWLLFMCPGKRELPGPHLDKLETPSDPLAQVKSVKSRINSVISFRFRSACFHLSLRRPSERLFDFPSTSTPR